MSRSRKLVLSLTVGALAAVPAFAAPAQASHRCGLGHNIVNSICESHPGDLPVLCKLEGDCSH